MTEHAVSTPPMIPSPIGALHAIAILPTSRVDRHQVRVGRLGERDWPSSLSGASADCSSHGSEKVLQGVHKPIPLRGGHGGGDAAHAARG